MRESQALNQNQNGFTLLSMMVALATLTIIAALVSNMSLATLRSHQFDAIDRKDIWIFLTQIKDELSSGQQFQTSSDGITFNLYGDTVDYKLIGTTVRRRLNSNGYEIVLQNVQTLSIQDDNQVITIELIDTKGRPYRWNVKKMIQ